MLRLSFHGAAETVTGSKYLLEIDNQRVLVDCGLFQGLKELRLRNWDPLPFDPASVDALLVTHAHIDHVGYIPRFVRDGFRGAIYCTPATAELTEITLYDSAKCQLEDADYANKKGFSKHQPALPLYDDKDVSRAIKLLQPRERNSWFPLGGALFARYIDAGHLLGSSMIQVEARLPRGTRRILFSGDVGRYQAPLYHDPGSPPPCDYLICESTYGDRDHAPEPVLEQVVREVHDAIARGGIMLVASFAIGRTQQLIYLMRVLMQQRKIPELPIYIDSPMAVDATNIYCTYSDEHDLSEGELRGPGCVLDGKQIHLARSQGESKAINAVAGPAMIISSSGMMTGGRILHHLKQRLPDHRNTVFIGGYTAPGTRSRMLADGARFLRIHGHDVPVRAAISKLPALSGHAGKSELLRWLEPLPPPKMTFLTHGELPSSQSLAETLTRTRGWPVIIPHHQETVELE
ncbi:MAG: MBL fold metallo-hydrolase [Pirellulales bacterium]|nr:MBL fold metallo-hydrolase [Pirellulales bacterium]